MFVRGKVDGGRIPWTGSTDLIYVRLQEVKSFDAHILHDTEHAIPHAMLESAHENTFSNGVLPLKGEARKGLIYDDGAQRFVGFPEFTAVNELDAGGFEKPCTRDVRLRF